MSAIVMHRVPSFGSPHPTRCRCGGTGTRSGGSRSCWWLVRRCASTGLPIGHWSLRRFHPSVTARLVRRASTRWCSGQSTASSWLRWRQRAFQVAHAQRDDACPRLHLPPASRRKPRCVARDHPCHPAEAANSSHSPGTPRSPTAPSGLKARSVPVTRSRTVRVTTTSRSPA